MFRAFSAQGQPLIDLAMRLLGQQRFLRFLVVGGINTLVGYCLFLLALALMPGPISALVISTISATSFNFLSTGRYVFHSSDARKLFRFVAVYGIVFGYNALGLLWLGSLGIAPQWGGLLLLPGAVAISYLLNRSFVFGVRQ